MSESAILPIESQMRPDRFFDAAQQKRLAELMNRWRVARDRGEIFPPVQQAELEALVEAELRASGARAAALAGEIGIDHARKF